MQAPKETALNSLLAALVFSSLVMSVQIWYSPGVPSVPAAAGPSVYPQPPAIEREMPDVFRPEMIMVRAADGRIAPVHSGTLAYGSLWAGINQALAGLRISSGAFPVDQVPVRLTQSPWVQLWLPTPLTISQWADLWQWDSPALRYGAMRVDRLTFYLGEPGAVYLNGPAASPLFLAEIPEEMRAALQQLTSALDPGLFREHRPLNAERLGVRTEADLLVPDISALPVAQLRIDPQDPRDEEARYFPDLSVVRQIDERDARSLTDGQRLLRFTASGMLEYRTADPTGSTAALDLMSALDLIQEWLGPRDGWPQGVVLRRYMSQPGAARFEFDYRAGTDYPVESVGPALSVHLSAQRVVYYSRYPSFVETHFTGDQQAIISPEEAVRRVAERMMLPPNEPIRSMHLAYTPQPSAQDSPAQWRLEPAWVIKAADLRVYVPAAAGKEQLPPQVVR